MKVISSCERQFTVNCISKKKRLDGRDLLQGRTIEIVFGKERGCCMVLQGNTRVLVQVSCDISEPKASTPTEGVVHVNLELSAMSAPDAKSLSRTSEEFIESQRVLERCIRDSKCIDLESLCIVSGSKVWIIRVDIHILNNDGNLIECSSVGAIAALSHFRRPEVTVVGTDVTIHSVEEKEPIALNLHHMPLTINLALFNVGKTYSIVADPSEMEEKVCDGCYIVGINAHQEMCFVHRRGVLLLKEDTVQQCEDIAVKRAQEVTQVIRSALDLDSYNRLSKLPIGFTNLIKTGTILGGKRSMPEINLESVKSLQDNTEPETISLPEGDESAEGSANHDNEVRGITDINTGAKERAIHILRDSEEAMFEGGPSRWGDDMDDDETEQSSEEENIDAKPDVSAVKEELNLDSEEEQPVYVNKDNLDVKTPVSRGWYSKDVML